MALLTMAPLTMQAERLFDQLRAHPTLRPDVTAYNVALKSRLSRRDTQGALQLHPLILLHPLTCYAPLHHTATPPHLLPPLTCLTPSPATGTLALIRKKSHYGVTLDVRVRVSEAGHGSLGLGSWLMVQP